MTRRRNNNDTNSTGNGVAVDRLTLALKTFTIHYGADESKLDKWQEICMDCGRKPGSSIAKCKKILRGVHVNIWDFIKAKEQDTAVPQFASKKALREDIATGKRRRFPLHCTKTRENKFLQAFLVEVY
ncbi:hypothetical protein K431DRAFT_281342 [Polychaeton citri CBS 116435]|uniref:Uncharacterized protein n=1 Tax=Polychaeton citri CBS 116435 TaxID=1314669 RepID=A0A9P4QFV6_9PEZI|nr:hypothetical protein K431DRAFT_281342 [Polychaeton citri CBS 116435]